MGAGLESEVGGAAVETEGVGFGGGAEGRVEAEVEAGGAAAASGCAGGGASMVSGVRRIARHGNVEWSGGVNRERDALILL